MENKQKELIRNILRDVRADMSDEEIIHTVLDSKLSKKIEKTDNFGSRAADKFAAVAGSWGFIICFTLSLVIWIIINVVLLVKQAFDPYPFILLNLVLSCVAAIQAPLIMMSQNRQEQKDRERADNDYKVNLKTEIIIQDMSHKLDIIIKKQKHLEALIDNKKSDKNKEAQ
jgi:uncharacterized membrane protein